MHAKLTRGALVTVLLADGAARRIILASFTLYTTALAWNIFEIAWSARVARLSVGADIPCSPMQKVILRPIPVCGSVARLCHVLLPFMFSLSCLALCLRGAVRTNTDTDPSVSLVSCTGVALAH